MSDEIIPSETAGWSSVLQELNFPKIVLGPAGEALSRLVGHVADVPSEYVKTFTQGTKDKREARTEVSKALANAVAAGIAKDRELIQRAAESFLAKELRAQTNREAVAKKAIEHLSDDSGAAEQNPETPEDDWMNVFERYAENASSEKLRDLWGRVLANQIRIPRTFSLRTMRFISELDAGVARLFEKYSVGIVNGEFLLQPMSLEGAPFVELLQLEEAGLLNGVTGNISQNFEEGEPTTVSLRLHRHAVAILTDGPTEFNFPTIMLTGVGKELLKIVDPSDDLETARTVADRVPRASGISSIKYGRMTPNQDGVISPVTAWERPPPDATA